MCDLAATWCDLARQCIEALKLRNEHCGELVTEFMISMNSLNSVEQLIMHELLCQTKAKPTEPTRSVLRVKIMFDL